MSPLHALQILFLMLGLAFAAAESPAQDAKQKPDSKTIKDKIKEIAGTAEFLRDVPKHFATLKAVDSRRNQVTLLLEGEVLPKVWSLVPDAEIKVLGWWGRLDHFTTGDRVPPAPSFDAPLSPGASSGDSPLHLRNFPMVTDHGSHDRPHP